MEAELCIALDADFGYDLQKSDSESVKHS